MEWRHHPFQLMAVLYGYLLELSYLVKQLERQCDCLFDRRTTFAAACRRVLSSETSATFSNRTLLQVDSRRLGPCPEHLVGMSDNLTTL